MAVARFTTWADTTEQAVFAGAGKVTSIIIKHNKSQSAVAFLQLFDVAVGAGVTPGATAPDWQFKIDTLANAGRQITKIVFPQGIRFGTAITAFCSTAASGGTAPTTTVLPEEILVFFQPHNE